MPTLTTQAKYKNGVLIPKVKPDFESTQIKVIFADGKDFSQTKKTGNAKAVLAALDKIKGTIPEDIDGVEYENQIRQESEQHFKDLNW